MNFLVLIVLIFFLNPLRGMESPKNESPKDKPKEIILSQSSELKVWEVSEKKEYIVHVGCNDETKAVTIVKQWKHWFDGWRQSRNIFPLVCLTNDQMIKIRLEGLCALPVAPASKNLAIMCPIIATFMTHSAYGLKKYDTCIVGKYGLSDQSYHSKVHVAPGRINRLKFKLFSDNNLSVTSYSRYDDTIAKMRQILNVNTFEEVKPTICVALWKKTQLP